MRAWNILLIFEILALGSEAAVDCMYYPRIVASDCCPYLTPYSDAVAGQCYENLTVSQPTLRGFPFNFCFSECYMNATQIFIDGKYNATNGNILFALEKVDAPEYIPFMTTVYQKCEVKVRDFLTKQTPDAIRKAGKCNPFPGLVLQCMDSEYVMNCPANNWINRTACNSLIDYFTACPLELNLVP